MRLALQRPWDRYGCLVASDLLSDEVASYVSTESLGYLPLEALTETAAAPARGRPGWHGVLHGTYPIPVEGYAEAGTAATPDTTLRDPRPTVISPKRPHAAVEGTAASIQFAAA